MSKTLAAAYFGRDGNLGKEEALTQIRRHAGGTAFEITLREDRGTFRVAIRDKGKSNCGI